MRFRIICLFFLLCGLFPSTEALAGRDPRVEEMEIIQEISTYLQEITLIAFSSVAAQERSNPQLKNVVNGLDLLNEKAKFFHQSAMKNSKSPWRTVSTYRELTQAFLAAQNGLIDRSVYLIDPQAFEDLAYLLGALLQFYEYPIESYTVGPGGAYPGYAVYPRAFYPWIPTFYNFSRCRFANHRAYPWGSRVVFK